MAKYLQCSECGKLAFYYDDFVGTEKPFYRRYMRYPEGETKHEPPRTAFHFTRLRPRIFVV